MRSAECLHRRIVDPRQIGREQLVPHRIEGLQRLAHLCPGDAGRLVHRLPRPKVSSGGA
jgi:hypothetical protein